VLVPCYKEGWGVVGETVRKAMEAYLPPGVQRTIYLCDDGKGADTRAHFEAEWGATGQAVYVSGRKREEGEINGKSANLNNCACRLFRQGKVSEVDGAPHMHLMRLSCTTVQGRCSVIKNQVAR